MINLCSNRHSLGTSIGGSATDGAFQEYFTIRQEAIIPLDDRVTYEQGSLLEPLAVCLCAARNGSFGEGERVAVIGAGPIGLMIVKFLKALGAGTVIVSDIVDERLKFATKYGADAVINARNESVADKTLELTDGVGVDRVIIAAATPTVMEDSLKMVRNGGNIVMVALMHNEIHIDPIKIVGRGISIIGSYMFTTQQKDAMELIATKQVYVDDIITSKHPMDVGEDLFKNLCSGCCKDIKVLVMP
jgi:L-iditol 2-dehydrogenase